MDEIFIEREKSLLRVAVKKNNVLRECYMEEEDFKPYPGEIYKGIVKNIVPAIKCAFIDIGYSKNCYMYLDRKFSNEHIKKGDEILVQILKEEIGDKGRKVTNAVSIPGRYVVLQTLNKTVEFSKSIIDEEYKNELKEKIQKPEDTGIIVRTNAQKVGAFEINSELENLAEKYKAIVKEFNYSSKLGLLFSDGGIIGRVIRDVLSENTSKVYTNSEKDYETLKSYIHDNSEIDVGIELYKNRRSMFDFYEIESEILSLRKNKVVLPCGGFIVIDRTEAMYVIDVNSGKNVKGNSLRKTAVITNLQAAEEISRQVRLRNLSGIILIDFIDMLEKEEQRTVLEKLQEGFEGDKNKTIIYPFTELNLVQIARRRRGKVINDYIEENCSTCHGTGRVLKTSYLIHLIKNEIMRINENEDIKSVYIEVSDRYGSILDGDTANFIQLIDALDKTVYLKFTNSVEYFKVKALIFPKQIESVSKYKIYG